MFVCERTYPRRLFKASLNGKVLGVIDGSGRQFEIAPASTSWRVPSETQAYCAETSNWQVQN
jgi:hypothetical protein